MQKVHGFILSMALLASAARGEGLLLDCVPEWVEGPVYRAYGWPPVPPPEARDLTPEDLGLVYDREAHEAGWGPYRGAEPDPGVVDRVLEWEQEQGRGGHW